jgi:hypothetical protein
MSIRSCGSEPASGCRPHRGGEVQDTVETKYEQEVVNAYLDLDDHR